MKKIKSNYKYVIIGAGPGGLQLGYFMEERGLDYIIIERQKTVGSFFQKYPVHRKLISINKKYNFFEEAEFNMRHDWNSLLSADTDLRFTKYSDDLYPDADTYYTYLNDYADKFGINILFDHEVSLVSKTGESGFDITLAGNKNISCEVLICGLGPYRQNIPDEIEGMEHTVAYGEQSIDLEEYKNKRVAVLGGGNSGFETADYLSPAAAFVHIFVKEKPAMAWDTHFVGDLRAVNNNVYDLYQLKSLHAVLNPRLRKIEKLPDGTLRTQHDYDYENSRVPGTLSLTRDYDLIINCTGWNYLPNRIFHEQCQPAASECGKLPRLDNTWQSVNVSHLYFIGASMQAIDKKSASGFIHGFRYNIRTLFNLLLEQYEGVSYPAIELDPFDWDDFLNRLYERLSTSAALFQLFGFLCDQLVLNADGTKGEWRQELPIAYAESMLDQNKHTFHFTLEFGFDKYNASSLDFMKPSDPHNTKCAAFLHPVIYHYKDGNRSEFHFGDSLLARWDRPHDTGGAVMSYHIQFLHWLKERTGMDVRIPESSGNNGAFKVWDREDRAEGIANGSPRPENICQ